MKYKKLTFQDLTPQLLEGGMSSQNALRYYEEQVLDAQYAKWPIWSYDKERIIYALFAAFDSMYVVFRVLQGTPYLIQAR